jgi:hypothetical protein
MFEELEQMPSNATQLFRKKDLYRLEIELAHLTQRSVCQSTIQQTEKHPPHKQSKADLSKRTSLAFKLLLRRSSTRTRTRSLRTLWSTLGPEAASDPRAKQKELNGKHRVGRAMTPGPRPSAACERRKARIDWALAEIARSATSSHSALSSRRNPKVIKNPEVNFSHGDLIQTRSLWRTGPAAGAEILDLDVDPGDLKSRQGKPGRKSPPTDTGQFHASTKS